MFTKSSLPYEKNALEPYISEETMSFHYDKHLQAYFDKLNLLIKDTDFEGKDLEFIVKNSSGGIFNNAGQAWNHEFFWKCMTPNPSKIPNGEISELINKDFGSFENFKEKFIESGLNNFGSGWTWLVLDNSGKLEILNYSNAGNPLDTNKKILLGVDVWEHAYYIDRRNDRKSYLNNFFEVINWDFVNENLEK
ncbi:superoxide dismutase [Fe] [Candidatus Gracilibacteria bacterium]|nr:MAG: superoxide dismutase [Fe] [Candidatus Gracilibacteria bacterium]